MEEWSKRRDFIKISFISMHFAENTYPFRKAIRTNEFQANFQTYENGENSNINKKKGKCNHTEREKKFS